MAVIHYCDAKMHIVLFIVLLKYEYTLINFLNYNYRLHYASFIWECDLV